MHSFSPDSLCLQALLWPKGEKVPRRAHVRLPSLVAEREALQGRRASLASHGRGRALSPLFQRRRGRP